MCFNENKADAIAVLWQILVENFVDPSHVPFAHHGVQGNRCCAAPIAGPNCRPPSYACMPSVCVTTDMSS